MEKEISVVVAGDITIDWLMYPVEPKDGGKNWQSLPALHSQAFEGGALKLAAFIGETLEHRGLRHRIFKPALPGSLREFSPDQVIHSNAVLAVSREEKNCKILHIEKAAGYMGVDSNALLQLPPEPNPEKTDIIVLDDAGNDFRDQPPCWPRALATSADAWIIHKMSRPLNTGQLWQTLIEQPRNLILVLNIMDIRMAPGIRISRAVSWERTAKDLLFHLNHAPALSPLHKCPYVIVLLDTDGALVVRNNQDSQATLVFDPIAQEGSFASLCKGSLLGMTSFFTASLVADVACNGAGNLEAAVGEGLRQMRALLQNGYRLEAGTLSLPIKQVLESDSRMRFATSIVEPCRNLSDPDPCYWRILEQKTRNTRLIAARDLAMSNTSDALRQTPAGLFGKMTTYDRTEIEQFNAIRELLNEYLLNPRPSQPLNFAVFGPPGSGKSFGVKQVINSLNRKDIKTETFNISQFSGYRDLVSAFHKIRDIGLGGQVPFIFFDEFDAEKDGQPLGWLKYFLAPMQDGLFRDGETDYHLGRAIFVFAGGTKSNFREFNVADLCVSPHVPDDKENEEKSSERDRAIQSFRLVKGPDFVSRLRGFIDVMGPNRQQRLLASGAREAENKDKTVTSGDVWDHDDAYVIRRAQLLYSLFRMSSSAADLFDTKKRLRIDPGVLRAFLHTEKYRHGARSMSAIIEMSRLSGKKVFDLSALPVKEQLNLHVDAEEFLFIAQKPRFVSLLRFADLPHPGDSPQNNESALVQALAEEIHNYYLRGSKALGRATSSLKPYSELSEDKKRSNIDAAEDIPVKLESIGCGLARTESGGLPQTPDITDEEVLLIAEKEHQRWICERRVQGWSLGPRHDETKKQSPYLIPFADLPPEVQLSNIEAVHALPIMLKNQGYEIYRMRETDDFADPATLWTLADLLNEQYRRNQALKGETPKSNPSLKTLPDLPPDLRDANLDAARDVPKKLNRLGYRLRRLRKDEKSSRLVLTGPELETLAKMEHERWAWQKRMQGWIYSPGEKNLEQKTSPHLIPWAQLNAEVRKKDFESVETIPELLEMAGFTVEPR